MEQSVRRVRTQNPELADQIDLMQNREIPSGWDKNLPTFPADAKGMANRERSGKVLNSIAQNVPWLIGGSADLATSNKTTLKGEGIKDFEAGSYGGRNFHFGIREHAMGAALNGMAVSKVRAFGANVFQLQRLYASKHPPGCVDGDARHLCFHSRLNRRWRGRPHPPTDRAVSDVAGDSRLVRCCARRCQRSSRGLEE